MEYIQNRLKQLKRSSFLNYCFFLVAIIFLIPGIILIVTRAENSGYAVIGVGLFILLIATIIYIYLLVFGFNIKRYLLNPKTFMIAIFLFNYWAARVAKIKPNDELNKIFSIEMEQKEFLEEKKTPDYFSILDDKPE